jgi:adenylate cyclase
LNRIVARRLRSTLTYILIGTLVGPVVGVVTGALDDLPPLWPGVRGAIAGMLIGAVVGVGEEFVLPRASRRLGFRWLNILRYGAYIVTIQGALLIVNVVGLVLGSGRTAGEAMVDYLGSAEFPRDLAFAVVVSLLLMALLQLRRLHHPAELWRLVTGRYHYPEEEEIVFLFVDLARSATLAERLGHIGFSRLLRDLFADLSEPILAWRGRVYQHLGDGVIVTWTTRSLDTAAAARCYFDMVSHLEHHREHYERHYDVVPTIRAAVHAGPVVATWVGEAKKELAYHGDTINATARMQGACRKLGVSLLVSEPVRDGVERVGGLVTRSMGPIELEGKAAAATLYAVDRAPAAS